MKELAKLVKSSCLREVGNGAEGRLRITAFFLVTSPVEHLTLLTVCMYNFDKK